MKIVCYLTRRIVAGNWSSMGAPRSRFCEDKEETRNPSKDTHTGEAKARRMDGWVDGWMKVETVTENLPANGNGTWVATENAILHPVYPPVKRLSSPPVNVKSPSIHEPVG